MKITKIGDNNTYLFLPSAGTVVDTAFFKVGSLGHYWSGTAAPNAGARSLGFKSDVDYFYAKWNSSRFGGYSVRPVRLVAVD